MEPPETGAARGGGPAAAPAPGRDTEASTDDTAGAAPAGTADRAPDAAEPAEPGEPAGHTGPEPAGQAAEPTGMAGLSLASRIVIGVVLAAVAVGAVVHLAMVFLYVSPPNTLSKADATTINGYIYPEFEQNWKLFAPDPLQSNSDVQARAEVLRPDGTVQTTGWVDLTAMDETKILHNPFPSHTKQNELRRAWSFYTDTHDAQDRPTSPRGDLAQSYVLHIVAQRFGPHLNGGTVQRVQVRSVTWAVAAPPWSTERIDTRPAYRVVPWWNVSSEDFS